MSGKKWLIDLELSVDDLFFYGCVEEQFERMVIHKVRWPQLEFVQQWNVGDASTLKDIAVAPSGRVAVVGDMVIGVARGFGIWGLAPDGTSTVLFPCPTTAYAINLRRSQIDATQCYVSVTNPFNAGEPAHLYRMNITTGARSLIGEIGDYHYGRFFVAVDDSLWWIGQFANVVHRWTPAGGLQTFPIDGAGIAGTVLVPRPWKGLAPNRHAVMWAVRNPSGTSVVPFQGIEIDETGTITPQPCMDVFTQPNVGAPTDARPRPSVVGSTPGALDVALVPHTGFYGGLWRSRPGRDPRGVTAVISQREQVKSLQRR